MGIAEDRPGIQVFVDPKVGFHVYHFENKHPHRYGGKPHPKVGVIEVYHTTKGDYVPKYTKGGGSYHQLYIDIPEIPPFCAALMKMYDEYRAKFEEMTSSIVPEVSSTARAEVERGNETVAAKSEVDELQRFAAESGLSDFSVKKVVVRRGPTLSESEKLIAEMEGKK